MSGKKVLLVLTSSGLEGCGGEGHAGFFLSELAHPYETFVSAGATVTIASVAGGAAHVAAASLGEPFYDAVSKAFWEDESKKVLTQQTKALSEYSGKDFDVVLYVGGYGTMTDFPTSKDVARVGEEVYTAGGHVAAVCHGPSALFNIKIGDEYLVKGKTVVAFTNEEEAIMGNPAMPNNETCEDVLVARGATFSKGEPWSATVVSSDRVHTGQNPSSAGALADAIIAAL